MGARTRVTMLDVAREAGVSTATVSFVLNQTKPVSPTVRQRVQKAMTRLGYVPSHAAQTLRTGRSATLGLIIPDLTNPFFPKVAQDLVEEARTLGYAVVLADSLGQRDLQQEAISNLQHRGVDAVLVVPTGTGERLDDGVMPTVVIDRVGGEGLSVQSDKQLGGTQAAQHLLDFGHCEFALLAGPVRDGRAGARVTGMLTKLQEHGISVPESHIYFSEYSVEEGGAGTAQLLRSGARFTALLCANDTLALGALNALRQAGLRVPEDVSLTGFDDISWAALSAPALTTVHQDTRQLAREALDLALLAIRGEARRDEHRVVPTLFIPRQSSGPRPASPRRPHQTGMLP